MFALILKILIGWIIFGWALMIGLTMIEDRKYQKELRHNPVPDIDELVNHINEQHKKDLRSGSQPETQIYKQNVSHSRYNHGVKVVVTDNRELFRNKTELYDQKVNEFIKQIKGILYGMP